MERTVEILEIVPPGWQIGSIEVFNWDDNVGISGPFPHDVVNPLFGQIEDGKLGCTVIYTNVPEGDGVGTPGWWKNRGYRLGWPLDPIEIGGISYSAEEARALMQDPTPGDKWGELFEQLVAAKLNVAAGNDSSCIASDIANADTWMAFYTGAEQPIAASSDAWQMAVLGLPDSMSDVHSKLDDYNNGLLCAPSMD